MKAKYQRKETLKLKLYQGSYAELWMETEILGTSPVFYIVNTYTGEIPDIKGCHNKDLKDMMMALQIYELDQDPADYL